jgi:hypothetical protein
VANGLATLVDFYIENVMKLDIDFESIQDKLAVIGLTEVQQARVLEILCEGLDIKLSELPLHIYMNEVAQILFFNKHGELATSSDTVSVSDFELRLTGLDSNNITKVVIPPLDYSSTDPLELTVSIFPFHLTTVPPRHVISESVDNDRQDT